MGWTIIMDTWTFENYWFKGKLLMCIPREIWRLRPWFAVCTFLSNDDSSRGFSSESSWNIAEVEIGCFLQGQSILKQALNLSLMPSESTISPGTCHASQVKCGPVFFRSGKPSLSDSRSSRSSFLHRWRSWEASSSFKAEPSTARTHSTWRRTHNGWSPRGMPWIFPRSLWFAHNLAYE